MIAIFDASSLISMSQSCIINLLGELKQGDKNTFVVPESVYDEVVKRPLTIRRFELNAVRLQNVIDRGWLEIRNLDKEHLEFAREIDEKANQILFLRGKPIKLIQRGEIDALALTRQLGSNLLVIDERTTRTIIESPKKLKSLMERRRKTRLFLRTENSNALRNMFADLNIVRSIELVALAFERNLLGGELPRNKQALEAALYAVKYAGCAISHDEIDQFLSRKRL